MTTRSLSVAAAPGAARAIIPLVDLKAQYESIKQEIDAAIADVIETSSFIRGPHVERFESEFAAATGQPHCISCANGTDALYIAMSALGVKPGDEVIVPAMSWISTSETVTQAGATLVFCDIDPITRTIDIDRLEACISERTVGIIPVHLYGQPANMPALAAIASRKNLWIIEDCAQAHLATIDGRQVGTFGVAATFSFYPSKNLGAMGDAGAIVTSDAKLAERMAMFARHGGLVKGDHQIEGINSRLDGLQGAVLSAKLRHLVAWTERRRELASSYNAQLAGLPGLTVPTPPDSTRHVYHLYVVQHDARDALRVHLRERGVETAINYPCALPFLPCYERLNKSPRDFPVAHRLQSTCVSLPLFPEMTAMQVEAVITALTEFCEVQ